MNKFREKIFDWYLKRQAMRQVVMYPWKDIRSIVILHEGHAVGKWVQQLQREGKQVYEIVIPDKKDISQYFSISSLFASINGLIYIPDFASIPFKPERPAPLITFIIIVSTLSLLL